MKTARLRRLIETSGLEPADLAEQAGVSEIRLIQLLDARMVEANLRLKTLMRILGVIAIKTGRPLKTLLAEALREDLEVMAQH